MSSEFDPAATDVTYRVDFNAAVDGLRNREMGGSGRLVVRAAEPRLVFSGQTRGVLGFGRRPLELGFRTEAIRNVYVQGAGVTFDSGLGNPGEPLRPFVFTCASAADAQAVAAALPARRDADLVANENFLAQLRQVPDAGVGLRSVSNLLLLANGLAYVGMGLRGAGWLTVASMAPYFQFGANNGAATTDGEWWRLVACLFLHYGVVHLLLNAWALFQAGHIVERLFGRGLFTLIYFGSGIAGSFATIYWNGDRIWSAGSSSAVFGVYGALLGYMLRERHGVPAGIFQPIVKSTIAFAAYNLAFGAIVPHIDNAAHIGGLLGGLGLGWLCALPLGHGDRARLRPDRARAGAVALGVMLVAGFATVPRFDYRLADEHAWRELGQALTRQRQQLALEERTLVAALAAPQNTGRVVSRLLDHVIPTYGDWLARIDALPLDPTRRTAQQRAELRRALVQRRDGFRRLVAELQAGDVQAVSNFLAAQRRVRVTPPAAGK